MENEQLQQPEPEKQPEKANKTKQILASMSTKEKKTILLIGFLGVILMLVINVLKIFLK
jgi:hypothetical protein